jgi:hypothetical protein
LYIYEKQDGAMAAISELLCDVTVLTQGNHGNQFTAQVQIDENARERERESEKERNTVRRLHREGVVSQW